MGCFNVVCSVLNLSIGHGTKVAFFPLVPNAYGDVHKVESASSLIYPNCYFNPFSLPIFGEYNDYGSLENIIEDENTKAIEQFFDITIQEFVDSVTCTRDVTDYYGELFKTYVTHQELMSNHQIQFDKAFLTKLGLRPQEETVYTYGEFPLSVKLTEDGYELLNEAGDVLRKNSGYDVKSKFIQDFEKETGYILLVSKAHQEKVKLLRTLSGMFVHEEIYKELAYYKLKEATVANGYVTEKVLGLLGFLLEEETKEGKLYRKSEESPLVLKERTPVTIVGSDGNPLNGYSYRLKEFVNKWEEATGEVLNMERFEKMYRDDVAFEEFSEWLNKRDKKDEPALEKAKKMLQDTTITEEVREGLLDFIALYEDRKASRYEITRHDYAHLFEEWEYFYDLYVPLIKKGRCKEAFTFYRAFYSSLYSCNRFFFPGMNGEQHGNLEASKMLLEKSLEIVNEELKERDY